MYITQGLKNAIQLKSSVIATIDGKRRKTWKELGARVTKLAGALKKLGLSKGARVAILALNSDRYFEYYYAVPWAGGVFVPLNIRLAPTELIFLMNDSGTEILLVDDEYAYMLPAFAGKLETVRHVVHISDQATQADTIDYETVIDAADPVPDTLVGGSQLAGIFYTGGTTGLPKGVMLSHDNIVFNALNALIVTDYGSDTHYLHTAPMFHMSDATSIYGLTMVQGTHVFIPKFDPESTLQLIESEKITNVTLVPTMINRLVNFSQVQDYDLSTLNRIWYGASPMPLEVMKKAIEIIPGCRFAQSYGMTELSPLATILEEKFHQLENPSKKIKSVGRAVPAVEIRIVDERDQEVPRNTVGEVVVRGDNIMLGYWNRPEETVNAVRDGWMHTQDAGYMDEDGFIYITDRMKDMIISGGENIYSSEVENEIYEHPAVESCAVIGIPDDQWGENVHAIVTLKTGAFATEEELITFCKKRLVGYKCPRSFSFQSEPLPLSGAGKILKSKLREHFWRGKEKQVN